MKNVALFPDKRALRQTAIQWLVRLEDGDFSAKEKAEFLAWFERDPRHADVFRDVARQWRDMAALSMLAELFPDKPALPQDFRKPKASRKLLALDSRTRRGAALAAGIVFISAVIWLWPQLNVYRAGMPNGAAEVMYETRVGEQSRAVLEDGSVIMLNTHTRARVHLTPFRRSVYLDRGEAVFDVAKNKVRPFTVYAAQGQVTAVGTAFAVRVTDTGVDVAVAEGVVEIVADKNRAAGRDGATSGMRLKERGIAHYRDAIDSSAYVAPAEMARRLAWKSGKLAFDGERLDNVIAEANRYTKQQLAIGDPAIASLQVGASFDAGDMEQLLILLKGSFGVEAKPAADGIIYLYAASNNTDI